MIFLYTRSSLDCWGSVLSCRCMQIFHFPLRQYFLLSTASSFVLYKTKFFFFFFLILFKKKKKILRPPIALFSKSDNGFCNQKGKLQLNMVCFTRSILLILHQVPQIASILQVFNGLSRFMLNLQNKCCFDSIKRKNNTLLACFHQGILFFFFFQGQRNI